MKSLRSLFHEEHDCNLTPLYAVIYYANEYACTVILGCRKEILKEMKGDLIS